MVSLYLINNIIFLFKGVPTLFEIINHEAKPQIIHRPHLVAPFKDAKCLLFLPEMSQGQSVSLQGSQEGSVLQVRPRENGLTEVRILLPQPMCKMCF